MTPKTVDERSFRLGMKYARDIMMNQLDDLSDENFIFRSAVKNISNYICGPIDECLDCEEVFWDGPDQPLLEDKEQHHDPR